MPSQKKIKYDWNKYFFNKNGIDLSVRNGISAFEKVIETFILSDNYKSENKEILDIIKSEKEKGDNLLKQWFIYSENGEKREIKELEEIYHFCATIGGRKQPELGILGTTNKSYQSDIKTYLPNPVKYWDKIKIRLIHFIYYYENLSNGPKITLIERMKKQNNDILDVYDENNIILENSLKTNICPLNQECFVHQRFPDLCPRGHLDNI